MPPDLRLGYLVFEARRPGLIARKVSGAARRAKELA